MFVYNIIDDKGRFVGLKYDYTKIGQANSHTYSYFYSRNLLKEVGNIMGLELLVGGGKDEKSEN